MRGYWFGAFWFVLFEYFFWVGGSSFLSWSKVFFNDGSLWGFGLWDVVGLSLWLFSVFCFGMFLKFTVREVQRIRR